MRKEIVDKPKDLAKQASVDELNQKGNLDKVNPFQ